MRRFPSGPIAVDMVELEAGGSCRPACCQPLARLPRASPTAPPKGPWPQTAAAAAAEEEEEEEEEEEA